MDDKGAAGYAGTGSFPESALAWETRATARDAARIECSALTPVLNEERHIARAVEAMRKQRFWGELEFLLVDGGSSDGTREILARLAREDPRIRLLDNPRGTTPSGLNVALAHARGRWVARMDAHTEYPEDYLLRGALRLTRGDTRWVSGPQIPKGHGSVSRAVSLAMRTSLGRGGSRRWASERGSVDTEYELDSGVFGGVWERETLLEYGGWDEDWWRNQDSELAGRFLARGERLVCLPSMGGDYAPRDSITSLWSQYFQYGQFRERTALRHPHTMRRSHLLVPSLVLTVAGSVGAPRPMRQLARRALLVYVAVLTRAALQVASEADEPRQVALVPVVLATMHLAHGTGSLSAGVRYGAPFSALARVFGFRSLAERLAPDPRPVFAPSLNGAGQKMSATGYRGAPGDPISHGGKTFDGAVQQTVKPRLKVLYVINKVADQGGAERFALGLATSVPRSRIEPWMCFTRNVGDEAARTLRATGVPFLNIGRRGKWDSCRLVALLRLLRQQRFDVVHAHMFGSNLWSAVFGRLANVPVVIAHEHSWPYEGNAVRAWLDGYVIGRLVTRFIAVSETDAQRMVTYEHIPEKTVLVMPTAYVPSEATDGDIRAELGIDPTAPLIAIASVLRPPKTIEVLLEAHALVARRVPGAQLVIAGDGPLRGILEKRAQELAIDHCVHFLGVRHDVDAILRKADVGVLSSDREGMPLFVFECMANGIPLVATAVGGLREVIDDGVSGVLVPPRDHHAVADALAALLNDPDRRARLSAKASERLQRFTIDNVASRFADLYEALVSEARR